jgi:hypothetical protein
MNMKKILCFLFSALSLAAVHAQTASDALRFSYIPQYGGTARTVGVGGAMGALGGDFATISMNPAGLATYRMSEFTYSPGFHAAKAGSELLNSGTGSTTQRSTYDRPQRTDATPRTEQPTRTYDRPQRNETPQRTEQPTRTYERPQRSETPQRTEQPTRNYDRPQRSEAPQRETPSYSPPQRETPSYSPPSRSEPSRSEPARSAPAPSNNGGGARRGRD